MHTKEITPLLIILDDLSKWNPYYPTNQVISARDYLFSNQYLDLKGAHVINLCVDSGYLSLGHYCSMIGEARGHKPLPSIKTMNDLTKASFYISDLDYLGAKVHKDVSKIRGNNHEKVEILSIFGKTIDERYNSITTSIFSNFPAPLMDVEIEYVNEKWKIVSLKLVSLDALDPKLEDFFANSIDHFSNKIWRTPKSRKKYVCDLGILITKDEALPPSDSKALAKFQTACEKLNVFCEFITQDDFSRINEFDAIFVRTTTSISNFTYNFVKNAEMEGLTVLDDSNSILRCTNKIYINNCLEKKNIKTIPGCYVLEGKEEELLEAIDLYGFPLICKIPDGSFSLGVKKANNREELDNILSEMFTHSSLVLIQKFMKTEYDWRIGVLDNKPIYACKYFMSQGHWQIYNHSKGTNSNNFTGKAETLPIYEVPHKVIKAALDSTSLIGNGLYGVDLKEDADGNVFVVEINDNPNIDSGVEDKIEKNNLYETIVKSFVRRVLEGKEKELYY